MQIDFKFKPGDYIRITLFGLNYEGRVTQCIFNNDKVYDVDYNVEGKIERKSFLEDELTHEKNSN